jgi:hypothetical protein
MVGLNCISQIKVFDTVSKLRNKDFFSVQFISEGDNKYTLHLKNLSNKSFYVVPNGSDIWTDDNNTGIIVLGQDINPLDDVSYYHVKEIKNGAEEVVRVNTPLVIRKISITIITKEVHGYENDYTVKRDVYFKRKQTFLFDLGN